MQVTKGKHHGEDGEMLWDCGAPMVHSVVIYAMVFFAGPFDGHWGRAGVLRFMKAAIHVILDSYKEANSTSPGS